MPKTMPWFKLYPKDFMDDENVKMMDDEALGLYMRMIFHCWTHGSIPVDEAQIMKLFKLTKHKFKKVWPQIFSCFFEKDSRFFQNRLERERLEVENNFQQKSDSGKQGAEKRWHRHKQRHESANGETMQDTESDTESDTYKKEKNITKKESDLNSENEIIEDPFFQNNSNSHNSVADEMELTNLVVQKYKNSQYSHEIRPTILNLLGYFSREKLEEAILKAIDEANKDQQYRPKFHKLFNSPKAVQGILDHVQVKEKSEWDKVLEMRKEKDDS